MDRVLRGARTTVRATFLDGETPVDADGAVTLTVLNDQGATVQTTAANKVDGTTGEYIAALLGDEAAADLDLLTLTWAGTIAGDPTTVTTQVEVVGGFHISLAQIRTGSLPFEPAKYPDDEVLGMRTVWEDRAEQHANRALVPRYRRLTIHPAGNQPTAGPNDLRAVRWASIDGEDLDVAGWTVNGCLIRPDRWLSPHQLLSVGVEYGLTRPPAHVVDVARRWIRNRLQQRRVGGDAGAMQTDDGLVMRESHRSPMQDRDADRVIGDLRIPAIA